MNEYPYSGLVHCNSQHSSQLMSIFYMKVSHHSTSNTSLNTGKIAKGHTFPITMTENWDLTSKQIACNKNLIDEIIRVINEL